MAIVYSCDLDTDNKQAAKRLQIIFDGDDDGVDHTLEEMIAYADQIIRRIRAEESLYVDKSGLVLSNNATKGAYPDNILMFITETGQVVEQIVRNYDAGSYYTLKHANKSYRYGAQAIAASEKLFKEGFYDYLLA